MKIKSLLIVSTLFFSFQASASRCSEAKQALKEAENLRDSYPVYSIQWFLADADVVAAESYVNLACTAATIGLGQ